jgi:hypothetical protein
MRHWPVWLAQSMRQRSLSEFHLDRLTPDWLPTRIQQRLVILIPALAVGLVFGLVSGLAGGLAFQLSVMLFVVLSVGVFGWREPVEQLRWSWSHARGGPGVELGIGLVSGLGVGLAFGLVGLVGGLVGGLFVGLDAGLVVGLVDERFTPNEGIAFQRVTLWSSG